MILHDVDYLIYPEYFVNKCHPDDYKLSDQPVFETIYHNKLHHNRLLVRLSFMVEGGSFLPLTFVCDTGAPSSIYLSEKARLLLNTRININDDLEIEFIK
jgi:hypothetical protein